MKMTDMAAGKVLHDDIVKASHRRRNECAGWMLLAAPPPVPGNCRSLLVSSVLEGHPGPATGVKELRKAAKHEWLAGRRAWGADSIELQLVKRGGPGHKGQGNWVWVNLATRRPTAKEKELRKRWGALYNSSCP